MTDTKKPREYFLERRWCDWVDENLDLGESTTIHIFKYPHKDEEVIHVIEKSAYDELVKAHDANIVIMREFQNLLKQVKPEIEGLEAKIDKLVSALKIIKSYQMGRRYSNDGFMCEWAEDEAKKALAEFEGEKK